MYILVVQGNVWWDINDVIKKLEFQILIWILIFNFDAEILIINITMNFLTNLTLAPK